MAGTSEAPGNIASYSQPLKGNPERGFAEADVIVEREFRTAVVHQGYIEPHAQEYRFLVTSTKRRP